MLVEQSWSRVLTKGWTADIRQIADEIEQGTADVGGSPAESDREGSRNGRSGCPTHQRILGRSWFAVAVPIITFREDDSDGLPRNWHSGGSRGECGEIPLEPWAIGVPW